MVYFLLTFFIWIKLHASPLLYSFTHFVTDLVFYVRFFSFFFKFYMERFFAFLVFSFLYILISFLPSNSFSRNSPHPHIFIFSYFYYHIFTVISAIPYKALLRESDNRKRRIKISWVHSINAAQSGKFKPILDHNYAIYFNTK